ncbi:MAG: ABC transporter substrate-binding protein [Chloroflexi bacterium]|nr:ABC transporter substrate-binding protein [Chloroflexota bacterium]
MKHTRKGLVLLVMLCLVVVGAFRPSAEHKAAQAQDLTPVRLQLKWVTQAQFAGYYAALNQGYYEEAGLDVEIIPGGPDISPQQVLAAGGAEFAIDWAGSALASREAIVNGGGSGPVNVAQIFQRSGMREIAFKDSGIESIEDLEGKNVGVWFAGNELPLFAALVANDLDPEDPNDVNVVAQAFDMVAFINGELDAAAAMTYNELAQVLEFVGEDNAFPVYTLDDLNIIDLNEVGTAMLEDGIYANEEWLADEANQATTVQFLVASFRGWIYCRDNPGDCVDYVLAEGSALGVGHQTWQMSEINKLIWPSELGVGQLDAELWTRTADIALTYAVIEEAADEAAARSDLAAAALATLQESFPDLDVNGTDWVAPEVEITPNGE